jgi:hypothetical protein
MKKIITLALMLPLYVPIVSADVSPECRGVAAGVVSVMKAGNEINDVDMMRVAVKAAQRACEAALEGLVMKDTADNETLAEAKNEKASTWDLLTPKQEKKAGNKRLDRLKN